MDQVGAHEQVVIGEDVLKRAAGEDTAVFSGHDNSAGFVVTSVPVHERARAPARTPGALPGIVVRVTIPTTLESGTSPDPRFAGRATSTSVGVEMPELVLVSKMGPTSESFSRTRCGGAGYQVRSVADGEAALREVHEASPDLVVLDIRLPGIDGWEVCRQIRQESNIPILIMTALAEEESYVKGLRLGADDYIAKPVSPIVLAARMQAFLRRHRRCQRCAN
jgi:CheY-like chemotaxis protein